MRSNFRIDLQNGDQLGATYTHNLEDPGRAVPDRHRRADPGRQLHLPEPAALLHPAPQHRVSGTFSVDTGSFYAGTKNAAAFRGRLELTSRFALEPNLSFNWIDLPQGEFTNTLVGNRATYTISPRMFVAALVQYTSSTTSVLDQRPAPLGIQPRQRNVRRLFGRSGHRTARARARRADRESRPGDQGHQAVAVLAGAL